MNETAMTVFLWTASAAMAALAAAAVGMAIDTIRSKR